MTDVAKMSELNPLKITEKYSVRKNKKNCGADNRSGQKTDLEWILK